MNSNQVNSCDTCQIDMTQHAEKLRAEEGSGHVFRCVNCKKSYPLQNGIVDLLNNDSDTALDVGKYIEDHHEDGGRWIYDNMFRPFFEQLIPERRFGFALEIGSGPGVFTRAVHASGIFNKIVASDISAGFLRHQKSMMDGVGYDLVRLDANRIPFSGNQFDVIFGNSVLHHFIDYKNTIRECFRLLKPGGIAVFGEPLLGGLLPAYLLADVICGVIEVDPSADTALRTDSSNLRSRALNAIKLIESKKDRATLLGLEDKFIFTNSEMRRLSTEVGFRSFVTLSEVCPDSSVHRQTIRAVFSQLFLPTESSFRDKLLLKYEWLVNSFERYLISPNAGEADSPSFATFAFCK
jgi:ubiquinone/menaquinone biosynthesis C-methylase UbiE